MRYLSMAFVALLVVAGCAKEEEQAPATPGKTPTKVVDDAKKAVDDAAQKAAEEVTFKCADPNCEKTKTGTLANPPS